MSDILKNIEENRDGWSMNDHLNNTKKTILDIICLSDDIFFPFPSLKTQQIYASYLNGILNHPYFLPEKVNDKFWDLAAYLSSIAKSDALLKKVLKLSKKEDLILGYFSKTGVKETDFKGLWSNLNSGCPFILKDQENLFNTL